MTRDIADYGLIGDGHTAALVANDGSIEWLCLPRFDSPACFAAMLGDEENGRWLISPTKQVTGQTRRYRGDSLILETELTCETGTIRLTDFMPPREQAPDIVRIVECIDGQVEIVSQLSLRFDYGRIHPFMRKTSGPRMLGLSGPNAVALDFEHPVEHDDRTFNSRFTLKEGEKSCFVLTWYPSNAELPERVNPDHALRDTEEFWREWSGRIEYSGQYRDAVVRSLITLKAMVYSPTGGIVAAPTSSLPEEIGGERNWDYRYCWLRDSTFALIALIHMGLKDEAREWIGWLRRAVGGEPIDLQPFYTIKGGPRAMEWVADWLPGYHNSRPVRFGNGAQGQLQLDIFGEVIDCLHLAREAGVDDGDGDSDGLVRMIASRLEDLWDQPDAGIWESRGDGRQHTYSKVMCWVAFDRAADWFEGNDETLHRRYAELAQRVRRQVLTEGWDEEAGTFVAAFGSPDVDGALLRLPMVGFVEGDDERMAGTIRTIEDKLCVNGFARRYDTNETDDGVTGGEGVFLAVSFWLVDAMYLQGRKDEARKLFERLLAQANDLLLLSEELEPGSGRLLGNFPQVLSHLALVRTAYRLQGGSDVDRVAASEESG